MKSRIGFDNNRQQKETTEQFSNRDHLSFIDNQTIRNTSFLHEASSSSSSTQQPWFNNKRPTRASTVDNYYSKEAFVFITLFFFY